MQDGVCVRRVCREAYGGVVCVCVGGDICDAMRFRRVEAPG